jgi:hypothetical protein
MAGGDFTGAGRRFMGAADMVAGIVDSIVTGTGEGSAASHRSVVEADSTARVMFMVEADSTAVGNFMAADSMAEAVVLMEAAAGK